MVFTRKVTIAGEEIEITPLVLLVALAVLLRIPSLFEPFWYGDEGIYLTLGEAARQGLVWYRDIFDHKPPMIYLFAAIAGSVFWFRFILLVWHAATIVLFWKLAESLFAKKEKAVLLSTAIFTLLTSIPLIEANIANSEIFMIGPTIAAMYLLFSAKKLTSRRIFASGVLFSLATLFKVPAAADLVALVVFWGITALWSPARIWEVIKRGPVLAAGFLLPILLTVDYYWMKGALREYLSTAWFFNLGYLQGWGVPQVEAAPQPFEANLFFRAQVLAVLLLALILLKKRFDNITLFSSIWLLFALFAMLLSGRPYPHYVIQVVPPLALLLGILAFGQEKYRLLTLPALSFFLVSLVFYKFGYYPVFSYYQNFAAFAGGQKTQVEYFESFDRSVPRLYKLAEILASRTDRGERVFVWGTRPEIYALSRRLPPTRFVTSFHIGDLSAEAEVLQDLRKNPPRYIIVLREEKRAFPGFFEFLNQNYIFVETVQGADIYKRISQKIIKAIRQ